MAYIVTTFKKAIFFSCFLFIGISKSDMVPFINIYVHGTQQWWLKTILNPWTWYSPEGICSVKDLSDNSAIKQDALRIHRIDPLNFNIDHYYTFGWPGNLSLDVRKESGKKLYEETKALLQSYKIKYGRYPHVRFVGFSHGGNVVLHALEYLPFFEEKVVLEAVLLVSPVQKITAPYLNSPYLDSSYVICTEYDLIQKLDFYNYQGKYYFSGQFFENAPKNCTQAVLEINNKTLDHTDFMHSCMMHIPMILKHTKSLDSKIPFKINSEIDKKNYQSFDVLRINVQDPGFIYSALLYLGYSLYGKRNDTYGYKSIKKNNFHYDWLNLKLFYVH